MAWYQKPEYVEYVEGNHYTERELGLIADQLLKEDAKSLDENGKRRGTKGDNPILFEEQLKIKRKREIHVESGTPDPAYTRDKRFPQQIPMYARTHPEGRKVNTEVQRKLHGASFYRS